MEWTKARLICSDIEVRTSPIVDLTMAHFGSYDLVPPQPTTVPTLEGAYKKVMSKLTDIAGFV